MDCRTVRQGRACTFMTDKGCSFNGGICHEVVEQCRGCRRATEVSAGWYCQAYPDPSKKWGHGSCNMATHVVNETTGNQAKLNPLKASKRQR